MDETEEPQPESQPGPAPEYEPTPAPGSELQVDAAYGLEHQPAAEPESGYEPQYDAAYEPEHPAAPEAVHDPEHPAAPEATYDDEAAHEPEHPAAPEAADELVSGSDAGPPPSLLDEWATQPQAVVEPEYGAYEHDQRDRYGQYDEAEPVAEVADVAEDGDEDEEQEKKKVPLGTKLLLVAAAWVLLTLFLVGVMNKDGKDDGTVRLSQAPGATLANGEEATDESGGEDGSGSSGGDGVEEGDADATVENYAVERGTGGGSGSSAAAGSGTSGTTTAGGTASGGGSTGGGSSGGGTSGGSTGGGSTGGGTTETTRSGGTSGPTTTRPPSTTTTTTGSSTTAAPSTVVVKVDRHGGDSEFPSQPVKIARGQEVRFENQDTVAHTLTFNDQDPAPLGPKDTVTGAYTRAFTVDTTVRCTISGHHGSVLIDVT